jgi:hypothetical protein
MNKDLEFFKNCFKWDPSLEEHYKNLFIGVHKNETIFAIVFSFPDQFENLNILDKVRSLSSSAYMIIEIESTEPKILEVSFGIPLTETQKEELEILDNISYKRFGMKLPEDLHFKIKMHCVSHKKNMYDFIQDAIEEYYEKVTKKEESK